MLFTDTHTHIYYTEDINDRKAEIQRSIDANVKRLFLPCVDSTNVALLKDLTAEYPDNCFAMLGLHPCQVKENYLEELAILQDARSRMKICAIGEIGIDLHWDKSLLKYQQEAFHQQIQWAKKLDLPIVIHCREAFDEVFEILEQHQSEQLRGVLHCFSGNLAQAQKTIEMGFYLGIGGVVTYKNAGLDKVVAEIDLKNIVLETDAPYLSPVPHRGKKNESAYIPLIAQKIADLKQCSLEEVAKITTENSVKVFGL